MLYASQLTPLTPSENQWKSQWRGDFFFSHGSPQSRGVAILIRNTLDFGLYKVGDLYDSAGELVIGGEFVRSALSPIDSFLLFSIYKALPLHWRNILCTNRGLIPLYTQHINLSTFYFYINNEGINEEKLQSKFLYGSLISRIANMPTAINKYEDL